MTEKEALKLALEAFEWNYNTDLDNIPACEQWAKMLKANITAIREALAQPEQEPQYAGTARELFTNAAIERLDVRPSTKVYLGTPSVCEQHQDWCASLTQMLASMPPKPAPCNCKLSQPEQEPVAWMYQDKSTHEVLFQRHMSNFVDHSKTSEIPLYSEPLANHELQCVCGAVWCGDEMVHLPNKTSPQRTWVGLTDEEVFDVWLNEMPAPDKVFYQKLCRSVEAKLKERNT